GGVAVSCDREATSVLTLRLGALSSPGCRTVCLQCRGGLTIRVLGHCPGALGSVGGSMKCPW
ncbi:unnamed protein product, partial [Staurois parvus]